MVTKIHHDYIISKAICLTFSCYNVSDDFFRRSVIMTNKTNPKYVSDMNYFQLRDQFISSVKTICYESFKDVFSDYIHLLELEANGIVNLHLHSMLPLRHSKCAPDLCSSLNYAFDCSDIDHIIIHLKFSSIPSHRSCCLYGKIGPENFEGRNVYLRITRFKANEHTDTIRHLNLLLRRDQNFFCSVIREIFHCLFCVCSIISLFLIKKLCELFKIMSKCILIIKILEINIFVVHISHLLFSLHLLISNSKADKQKRILCTCMC